MSQMSQIHHYSCNIYNESWQNYEVNLANRAIFMKEILAKLMKQTWKTYETVLEKLMKQTWQSFETNLAKLLKQTWQIY